MKATFRWFCDTTRNFRLHRWLRKKKEWEEFRIFYWELKIHCKNTSRSKWFFTKCTKRIFDARADVHTLQNTAFVVEIQLKWYLKLEIFEFHKIEIHIWLCLTFHTNLMKREVIGWCAVHSYNNACNCLSLYNIKSHTFMFHIVSDERILGHALIENKYYEQLFVYRSATFRNDASYSNGSDVWLCWCISFCLH